MNMTASPPPQVEHRMHVTLPPAVAFAVFAAEVLCRWPFARQACFGDEALDDTATGLRDQYDGGWPATLAAQAASARAPAASLQGVLR
jgi:hypothetical protein